MARALGDRLWGVRLDTSRSLVDKSLWNELGDFDPRGVNDRLVWKVREALDRDGFERIKIVVSGGMNAERIREFEELGVPVDSYGVGSALIRGENDFTADVVLTDGRPSAKVGRRLPAEPAARARGVPQLTGALIPGQLSIGSVERTTCIPAVGEALEGGVGLLRVVEARDDDRRGAVLEQVRARGESENALVVALEQVVDRPGDAVALRLPGDDHRVVGEQLLDQQVVLAGDRIAVGAVRDLRAEHRVVLGQRVVALTWKSGWLERAIVWKKIASSTAETSAWPTPPSIAWYGQIVSVYLPLSSSFRV